MTEAITATSSAQTATTASTGSSANNANVISSDFETFLRMLTAQLENQDPLNPMESTDFAVQLATFSGVEQQVKTNDLLTSLGAQLSAMSMAELASWVGMEARVAAPAHYTGTPIEIAAEPGSLAASANLVVYAADGSIHDQINIPTTGGSYSWTGLDSSGQPAPTGDYTFRIESYDQTGTLLGTSTPEIYTTVQEARNSGGEVQLVVSGGHLVAASGITAIRAAQDG